MAKATNKTAKKKTNNKDVLQQIKNEAAATVGVTLKQGYNGDLTAREAGSVGGEMVKKMIESYENSRSR